MATSLLSSGVRFPDNSVQSTPAYTSFRNRIINGDMRIDQRNSGASVTLTRGTFNTTIDRWKVTNTGTNNGSVTIQQDTVTSPYSYGFPFSLKITNITGGAAAAGDNFSLYYGVEGYYISDLRWGTSAAKTVTLSFYVKCNTIGTFGASLRNSAASRSYVAAFTISAVDVWQFVSVSIPGDTTGVWAVNNSVGIYLAVGLGVGSTYQTLANSWQAGNYFAVTGQTNLCTISGAIFNITGVQLEKGSVVTEFEYRPYQVELTLCHRYYQRLTTYLEASPASGGYNSYSNWFFKVPMRTSPIMTNTGLGANGTIYNINYDLAGIYKTTGVACWGATSTADAEF